MGRRKAGKEDIRKIQKTGSNGGSYMVTLPKELVEKLGWRENQKVVINLYGKRLTIKDWTDQQ